MAKATTQASAADAIKAAMANVPPLTDGRRERSLASRRKILEAMVDLVAAGDPNPSAAAVAEKAGVGLRSVFRHFEDKDAILREIDDLLVAVYQPILSVPYEADDWRSQLDELIERRCQVNEAVVIFRLSSILARYRSPFVVEKSREIHAGEKRMLDEILPASLQTSTPLGVSIMVATSFDTWRYLRQDVEMSAPDTAEAIKGMVSDILARAETEA
ncbi:MAG: TetR/AcrR family transcriptional regulator [Erythrobacter sp.]|nr:TetR/AcrR family transcriptional regulator [Erythrobacter sp.]